MTDQIQKLAEELYYEYWKARGAVLSFSKCSLQNQNDWKRLAKHVLERELEARIEENKKFIGAKYTYECGLDATRTIAELTNQLQQLRGGE